MVSQDHGLAGALDNELIEICAQAISTGEPVRAMFEIRNVNRTVGTMLGSKVTSAWGGSGLPDGTIELLFTGSAGQSFGAFIPSGITLRLEGDANDYVGKGLSGGRIVVRPARESQFVAESNIIAGNVIGYGATSGEIYLRGIAGERFCVRNSGATAVVEGIGDHGLEYMTGGRVVILGPTGRNLAAGMSGGIAYVLDLNPMRVNTELVDLESLSESDIEWLTATITRHLEETDSAVARDLLANIASGFARFTKIMPRDYRRALLAQEQALAEGRDPDVAVMEAANA
jgi:glutamate synthase (NADPH/NADH) large chain